MTVTAPAGAASSDQAALARPRILCVDDEPQVLDGMRDTLGRRYDITTADSGIRAISELRLNGPFDVVISDMRMPLMDGARFLTTAFGIAPDTTRIVLTGYAEVDSAIAAVNSGSIFRFLVKPCAPDDLLAAIDAGVAQYQLINTERVLLEKTLLGTVDALLQVLAYASPSSFGATERIRKRTLDLLTEIGVKPDWQIELACKLCMIGNTSLGLELAEKHYTGARVDLKEKAKINNIGAATDRLLAGIPRLEVVREYLGVALGSPRGLAEQPIQARALRTVIAFDRFVARGLEPSHALDALKNEKEHGEDVLEGIAKALGAGVHGLIVVPVAVQALELGQLFAQDVKSTAGHLLVTHLQPTTEHLIERLKRMAVLETIEYKTIQMLVTPNSSAARAASRYEDVAPEPVGLPLAFGCAARMALTLRFGAAGEAIEVERASQHAVEVIGDLDLTIAEIARVTITYPENVVEVAANKSLAPTGSTGFHSRDSKEVERTKPTGPTPELVWEAVSKRLAEELNEKVFAKWFGPVRALELAEQELVLAVPDEESRDWIGEHYAALLAVEVRTAADNRHTVRLVVKEPDPEAEGVVYTPTVTVEAVIALSVSFGEGYELTALEPGEKLRLTLSGDVDLDIVDVARLTVHVEIPEPEVEVVEEGADAAAAVGPADTAPAPAA